MKSKVQSPFTTYLINLPKDSDRREYSLGELKRFSITPTVVPAVDGHKENFPFHRYRNFSRNKWWNRDAFKPGAFGCYLSHALCWKEMLQGKHQYSLIVEDDITINEDEFLKFTGADLPENFDIIFVNFGVAQLFSLTSLICQNHSENFISIGEKLPEHILNEGLNDKHSPGSYGYFVSKTGADKLLKIMELEKVCMGVDYAMLFSAIRSPDLERLVSSSHNSEYLQCYLDNLRDDGYFDGNRSRYELNAFVWAHDPVISHRNELQSTLNHLSYLPFSVFELSAGRRIANILKSTFDKLRGSGRD